MQLVNPQEMKVYESDTDLSWVISTDGNSFTDNEWPFKNWRIHLTWQSKCLKKKKNEQATSGNKRGEEGEAHHFGNELSK